MSEKELLDQTIILCGRKLYIATAVLSISIVTGFVDNLAISILLPQIGNELNSADTISWAGTSVFMGTTIVQIVSGKLTDIFGRKRVLLLSMAIEIVSQLAIGLCTSSIQLFIFRAIAGIGDGGVSSITMMIMSDYVAIEDRGKYQAILGSCLGLASAIAPFIGSAFSLTGHWRGLYWFLCPLTVINYGLVWRFIPSVHSNRKITLDDVKKIDGWGLFSSSASIALILVALSGGGNTFAWNSALTITLFTVGGCLFFFFIFSQKKLAKFPTMPLKIFKNFTVSIMFLQTLLFGIVWNANLYFLPFYFELVRGLSTIQSSCMMLPFLMAQCIASIFAGQIVTATRKYGFVIQLGFFASTLAQGLQMGLFNQKFSLVGICFILVVQGTGVAFVFQPTIVALQAHCESQDRAVVISMRNFIRSMGGSIGIAASSALMSNIFKKNIRNANLEASPLIISSVERHIFSRPDLTSLSPTDKIKVMRAINNSVHVVFIFYFPLIAFCCVLGFFIKDQGLGKPDENETVQDQDLESFVEENVVSMTEK